MILIRCRPAIGNSVENQKKWEIFRIRLRTEVPIYHIFLAEDFWGLNFREYPHKTWPYMVQYSISKDPEIPIEPSGKTSGTKWNRYPSYHRKVMGLTSLFWGGFWKWSLQCWDQVLHFHGEKLEKRVKIRVHFGPTNAVVLAWPETILFEGPRFQTHSFVPPKILTCHVFGSHKRRVASGAKRHDLFLNVPKEYAHPQIPSVITFPAKKVE